MSHSLKIFFFILSLLLGASEATRLWWFSRDQGKEQNETFLKWTPPKNALDRKLSETRGGKILSYDSGVQVLIQSEESQISTEIIYLEYEKGNVRALVDLFSHSPELCLPASGAKFIREFDSHTVRFFDRELLIRQWLFQQPISGDYFYAFKVVWSLEPEVFEGALFQKNLRFIRLRAAAAGWELPASRMILAVVTNADNSSEAWKTFKELTIDRLSQPVE
ncbi:MAG: hypothetical protein ACJA1W_004043 [Akkermansiaceae bacterium]|jgi:hypothetical protein